LRTNGGKRGERRREEDERVSAVDNRLREEGGVTVDVFSDRR